MAATGRNIRDRAEAMDLLRQWETSGELMSTWCAARGLNWYSLSGHRGWVLSGLKAGPRRSRTGPPTAGKELQLVEVALPATVTAEASTSNGRYRIERGDTVLELDNQFDDDQVRRLLRLLAE